MAAKKNHFQDQFEKLQADANSVRLMNALGGSRADFQDASAGMSDNKDERLAYWTERARQAYRASYNREVEIRNRILNALEAA